MSLTVTGSVIVSADPAALDEDRSPETTVFPISTSQHDDAVIGEVICRDALAVQARSSLRAGQRILVTGRLTPRPAVGRGPDSDDVLLVIEATQIAATI